MLRSLALLVIATCIGALVLRAPFHKTPENEVAARGVAVRAADDAASQPLPDGFRADSLVVEKARREMHLYSSGELQKTYRVALGWCPVGRKDREGDGRTPEGRYTISRRNPGSSFHLSLRVSYPNATDIESARRRGVSPGGDIFIHGTPGAGGQGSGSAAPSDWTLGCIAVMNDEMDELWRAVPDGTPVVIRP
jgi:murein L,D-transpeptidase YafK